MLKGAIRGLVYGVALDGLGILSAGAGHGTNLPLVISSAPFALLGWAAAVAGAPLLWCVVGAMVGSRRRGSRRFVIAVLLVHYAALLFLATASSYADWAYVRRSFPAIGLVLAAWAAVYLGGQATIWRSITRLER